MNKKISDKISLVFEKIEGKNRYYVFIGILLFVFLLDYFVLMSPQLAALRKITPEIRIVQDNIKKLKKDMQKLGVYRRDLKELNNKFDETNTMVKSRDDVSMILEHIAYVASEYAVKIDQMIPDMLDQELLAENSQRKYFDLPIYIEARSGYHNFGRFLNNIGTEDISLRIAAFTISATNDTRYHVVKITFKATVFEEILP